MKLYKIDLLALEWFKFEYQQTFPETIFHSSLLEQGIILEPILEDLIGGEEENCEKAS